MEKSELLYEGKGKRLFTIAGENEKLIAEFKDDLTAFNAQKKSNESGKGALNNEISTLIFKELMDNGIKTHFIEKLNEIDMLVKKVSIIPIEVVLRNVATGSLTRRLGIKDGKILSPVLVEFYYKEDALDDPIITEDHAMMMEIADSREDLEFLKAEARKVNDILIPFFDKINLRLIDFKLEFGKTSDGQIVLADEVSPDSCRFWDKDSGEKLDKDRFRNDMGGVKVAYEEVRNRILGGQK